MNDIIKEKLIDSVNSRAKRALGTDVTLLDGSGSEAITVESSTYLATTTLTIQLTDATTEITNQSTANLNTEQSFTLNTTGTSSIFAINNTDTSENIIITETFTVTTSNTTETISSTIPPSSTVTNTLVPESLATMDVFTTATMIPTETVTTTDNTTASSPTTAYDIVTLNGTTAQEVTTDISNQPISESTLTITVQTAPDTLTAISISTTSTVTSTITLQTTEGSSASPISSIQPVAETVSTSTDTLLTTDILTSSETFITFNSSTTQTSPTASTTNIITEDSTINETLTSLITSDVTPSSETTEPTANTTFPITDSSTILETSTTSLNVSTAETSLNTTYFIITDTSTLTEASTTSNIPTTQTTSTIPEVTISTASTTSSMTSASTPTTYFIITDSSTIEETFTSASLTSTTSTTTFVAVDTSSSTVAVTSAPVSTTPETSTAVTTETTFVTTSTTSTTTFVAVDTSSSTVAATSLLVSTTPETSTAVTTETTFVTTSTTITTAFITVDTSSPTVAVTSAPVSTTTFIITENQTTPETSTSFVLSTTQGSMPNNTSSMSELSTGMFFSSVSASSESVSTISIIITNISTTSTTTSTTTTTTTSTTTTSTLNTTTTTASTTTTSVLNTITTTSSATTTSVLNTITTTTSSTTTTSILSTTTTSTLPPLTTITFTTTMNPSCSSMSQVELFNGTCVSRIDGQIFAVNILRSNTTNGTVLAQALTLYIDSVSNSSTSLNESYTLTAKEIDTSLFTVDSVNLTINTNDCFLLAQPPSQGGNVSVVGALFRRTSGGQVVKVESVSDALILNSSAAAIIDVRFLVNATSLNVLIINKPTTYTNVDKSNGKNLASSVVVVTMRGGGSIITNPVNISLYFQVLNEYRPDVVATYMCMYYDTNTSKWNDSGCSTQLRNSLPLQYQCNCNHLSTFALIWSRITISCNASQVQLTNGTCVPKADGQVLAVDTLRSNTTNGTVLAQALTLYIDSVSNSSTSLNQSYKLPLADLDNYVSIINGSNLTINTNTSFFMAQQTDTSSNIFILGASFKRGNGGQVVDTANKDSVTNTYLSTAAIISNESLSSVVSLNMFIIDSPTAFQGIDNSTNKTLASSVIIVSAKRKDNLFAKTNIALYFQVLNEFTPNISAQYLCSFFDNNTSQWNESGCTQPTFNEAFKRYECTCDHLTSFALLWLPQGQLTTYLTAQDIGSLVCLSISIVCFLAIIVHAIIIRIHNPVMSFKPYDLVPLISCASTTLLFIFYIALGMTVYTKTSSVNQSQCFLSSSVLMFFVYFLLIFMFCTKTSVGYFNYLRFICLFPQPSIRRLLTMLVVSFFISISWVAFAAGFNSNPSFKITQLYPYKLCWFTRDVIYYFLTIPTCLFLLINVIVFILVAIRIINHARHATSPHQSFERMKRCVLILLSSCATQGIGWLFGPFLTIINPEAGNVLGWFFIIFNGLEGLWSIILYLILRSKHMDEQKRAVAVRDFAKTTSTTVDKNNKSSVEIKADGHETSVEMRGNELKHRNRRNEDSSSFDGIPHVRDTIWPSRNDSIRSYSEI